eukprot:COSAG03_NODE_2656_length_2555_cov_0.921417_2_plen_90_part_00
MVAIRSALNRSSPFRSEAPKSLAVDTKRIPGPLHNLVVRYSSVSRLKEPQTGAMADPLTVVVDSIVAEGVAVIDICLRCHHKLSLAQMH